MNNESLKLLQSVITNHSDGAAYELIMVRFRPLLCKIMRQNEIPQEAEYDLLMDFYLYLRDGKGEDADRCFPFAMFMGLNSPETFPLWLKIVFKRWISRRLGKATSKEDSIGNPGELPDEIEENNIQFTSLYMAIMVMETVNSTFSAPERLIFFYDLYTIMVSEPSYISLSNTLKTTEGNIRVMRSRVKKKVRKVAEHIKNTCEDEQELL